MVSGVLSHRHYMLACSSACGVIWGKSTPSSLSMTSPSPVLHINTRSNIFCQHYISTCRSYPPSEWAFLRDAGRCCQTHAWYLWVLAVMFKPLFYILPCGFAVVFTGPSPPVRPEEVDRTLQRQDSGVESALLYAKAWSKYTKELLAWVEKRLNMGELWVAFWSGVHIYQQAINRQFDNTIVRSKSA